MKRAQSVASAILVITVAVSLGALVLSGAAWAVLTVLGIR